MTRRRRGRLLKKTERDELVELLEKGVSRTAACRKLGVSYQSFLRTKEHSAAFAAAVRDALATIDENVEMALYRAAMEGSVPAQTFWLKSRAEGWTEPPHDETQDDQLARLSDQELVDRAHAEGIDLPPEVARRMVQAHRASRTGHVPNDRPN